MKMSLRLRRWSLSSLVLIVASLAQGDEPPGSKPQPAGPAAGAAKAAESASTPAPAPAKPAPPKLPATGLAIGQNKATPVDRIRVAKGFRVELLYSVPSAPQGSWINLCVDSKGRILTSDQYGGLYRIEELPPPGKQLDPAKITKVPAPVRGVNGMTWAFDALYVVVNDYEKKIENGLYRVTDSDGDDQLDNAVLLRSCGRGSDHGSHAIVPSEDGKSLYWINGNQVKLFDYTSTRVPRCWGEDHLLPRMPDSRGFMRDTLGPGGTVYRVSPDGRQCELVAAGFRNLFDAALNRDGELITYDADMEDELNTSWYRPTRVCHITSGAEYGWRNGAGKRPEWYPDNLPPVVNIGPGSPTGLTFGYGAKFPARYQEALFMLDWSWGNIFAVHLKPSGSTYTAVKEDFISGMPLPVTDVLIHPQDGAMYFTIGGRRVQSGLYRVTYVGDESTAPAPPPAADPFRSDRALRHRLEAFHGQPNPQAVSEAWPYLNHADRFIQWAARTALEFQPAASWADRALAEPHVPARLEALLGLARITAIDPQHRRPDDPPNDTATQARIVAALLKLDWNAPSDADRIKLLRIYEICFARSGPPADAVREQVIAQLDAHFPAPVFPLNWMLLETLVYLEAPTAAAKGIALLEKAPGQEEQIEYARSLRALKTGWTLPLRTSYINWFIKAANYRGGVAFDKWVEQIRNDALKTLSEQEQMSLAELLAVKPQRKSPLENMAELFKGRTQHSWMLDELAASAERGLKHRNFEQGRKMYSAALCYSCHRFNNEGGMTGPDLSGARGRYSARDFLDQIINPSKVINEQFVPTVVVTEDDEMFTGVVTNLFGDVVMINTDLTDPSKLEKLDRKKIVSMGPSKISPMPVNLLGLLTEDEILDLLAYVLSGGDAQAEAFRK